MTARDVASRLSAYQQARADFEFLEGLAEVEDMVEIDAAVWDLMRSPTKAKAAEMYQAAIRLWFAEHGDDWRDDESITEIAERNGVQQ